MAEYHMDEAVFELPVPWEDKTVHALSLPLADGAKLGVTVSREAAPATSSLSALVDRALHLQQQKLPGFELVSRGDGSAGGMPSVEVVAKWRHATAPIYQHHLYVAVYEQLLVFTVTTTWKHRGECGDALRAIAGSLKFRERPT